MFDYNYDHLDLKKRKIGWFEYQCSEPNIPEADSVSTTFFTIISTIASSSSSSIVLFPSLPSFEPNVSIDSCQSSLLSFESDVSSVSPVVVVSSSCSLLELCTPSSSLDSDVPTKSSMVSTFCSSFVLCPSFSSCPSVESVSYTLLDGVSCPTSSSFDVSASSSSMALSSCSSVAVSPSLTGS